MSPVPSPVPPESPAPSDGSLQFDRADYSSPDAPTDSPPAVACAGCEASLRDVYHERHGQMFCTGCRTQIEAAQSAGAGMRGFTRAALYGAAAAALGSALYFAISALTGYEFGLIAVVVGVMVGKAVQKGSQGRGGRRYQALAMALTYLAIVTSYVPQVWEALQKGPAKGSGAASAPATPGRPTPAAGDAPVGLGKALVSLAVLAALLVGIAMVAPILGGFQNILGLVIIGIGLYEAWKLNRKPVGFQGPLQMAPSDAPA